MLLASTLTLASCGTFLARGVSGYSNHYEYYIGTRANVELVTMHNRAGYDAYATVLCWATIVCPVVAIVTLPVDMAVDTVLLPHDAMN
ncbi:MULTISPECIES: YceK/YidQ family lipoprotein [Pseudomonas]|uniref:YceK/YidQ family lipoprotein n=1 Tax=Pseudomonas TaxID=286 RepID=UPI0020B70430|nr:YceK/YidQ family lipoprotein [Pseudomonas sp. SBB6]MCP3748954.1 YceK/YidQ family lipoprotein [Pseudomonas sp. SBB6]WSE81558.1 YceK/YidQ family lipoprotein [Pseudomonas donghuensis]